MNRRIVSTVYFKELKDALRDRRTLISTILIPTFIMPLLIFVVGSIGTRVVSRAQAETLSVGLVGGADSPGAVAALRASPKLRVAPAPADWSVQISEKRLRAVVSIPDGFDAALAVGTRPPPVIISHYQGELRSGLAAAEIETVFRELAQRTLADRLAARGLSEAFVRPIETRRQNVAAPEQVGGNALGGLVPYLIIALCFTGAMYPAVDLTAGEKERGTLEALLCSPAGRRELVLGKFLLVLTGSLASLASALVSLSLSLVAGGFTFAASGGAATARGAQNLSFDPWGVLGVLGMVLPVAVLFAAITFTVALFARTQKEAQSYLAPMIVAVLLPAILGILPGIELDWKLALLPILNLSLVCREMLSGTWNWDYILLIFGSTCAYAAAALWLAVRIFNRESVLFR